jgi:uncharacterized protein (TIGR03067 family)
MKRLAVAGGLMLAAFAGIVVADDKALKELEGTYTVTALQKGGKDAPKDLTDMLKVSIKGDDFVLMVGSEEKKAKIKVDSSKTPHTIDITPSDGPDKGKTFPGIYKADKGEVTIVFTEKGTERPKDLKSEGDTMLVKMKKEEKK